MRRNRSEISGHVLGSAGTFARRRGIVGIDHVADGAYVLHFPADKVVRPDQYHFWITPLSDAPRVANIVTLGGASIGVRVYDELGRPANSDFLIAAERI